MHEIVWNSVLLDFRELTNILPRAVKDNFFSEAIENCKIFACSIDKEVGNFDDLDCPKYQDLVDEEK